jgi:hypothetical protein
MTAVRSWLTALHGMAPAEREATLGLVSDLGAARDVSTETHVLPLVPLIVPVVQSVLGGGMSARDASAVAAVKLLASLSAEQAGLRAVHGAGVLPLLLPLMRAGSAAGEGAYLSAGGTLLKRALADAEARPVGVRVVEAVVGMLPAAEGVGFDPFDADEARLAAELLITIIPHQAVAVCEAGAMPRLAKAASEDAFVAPRRLSQLAVEMLASLLQQRPTSNELTPSITRLLVRSSDGATAPHAARVALLKDALPALSKEVRRNMAEACIGVLGLRNAPDELQEAAARRLLDEPDRTLRADVLPRWCAALQAEDADASSRTARVLARVWAAELDAVPSALRCVITALAEAAPAIASDLASVVHAIAGARSQEGYSLLLDGGAVQALLRQLPHDMPMRSWPRCSTSWPMRRRRRPRATRRQTSALSRCSASSPRERHSRRWCAATRAVLELAGRSRTCSQPMWAARPSASCSLGFSSRATRKSAPSPRTWASGWSTWCSAMGSSPSTACGYWITSSITQMRPSSSSSWWLRRHSFPPWSRTWTRTMWRRSRRPLGG